MQRALTASTAHPRRCSRRVCHARQHTRRDAAHAGTRGTRWEKRVNGKNLGGAPRPLARGGSIDESWAAAAPKRRVSRDTRANSGVGVRVANTLRGFGLQDEVVLLMLGSLPVVELRGAVPVAMWMGMHPLRGYIISVAGNMIPVPLVLLFLEPISRFLSERSERAAAFFTWLFERSRRKASKGGVQGSTTSALVKLMLFVAVPLPLTGAWTGAIIAVLLALPKLASFIAILLGVAIAGVVMTLVSLSGWLGAAAAGCALAGVATGALYAATKSDDGVSDGS